MIWAAAQLVLLCVSLLQSAKLVHAWSVGMYETGAEVSIKATWRSAQEISSALKSQTWKVCLAICRGQVQQAELAFLSGIFEVLADPNNPYQEKP